MSVVSQIVMAGTLGARAADVVVKMRHVALMDCKPWGTLTGSVTVVCQIMMFYVIFFYHTV